MSERSAPFINSTYKALLAHTINFSLFILYFILIIAPELNIVVTTIPWRHIRFSCMKCFAFTNGDSKMDGGGAKVQEPNTAGMLCIEFARYCCSFQHPVSDVF